MFHRRVGSGLNIFSMRSLAPSLVGRLSLNLPARAMFWSGNGCSPVSSIARMMPIAHTSHGAARYHEPRITSGAA